MKLFNRSFLTRISGGNRAALDERAFDSLWDEFAPRVRGYLFQLAGNRAEAEDLTQETFLAAFHGRDSYKGDAQPLAWLLGIARRRWRDSKRQTVLDTAPLNEEALAVADRTLAFAEAMALRSTLADALNTLSAAERDVLLLTAVQGLTYKEAALVREEPVGTIKWRVFEATRKMRQILTAQDALVETQPSLPETTYAKPDARTNRSDRNAHGDQNVPRIARASRSR